MARSFNDYSPHSFLHLSLISLPISSPRLPWKTGARSRIVGSRIILGREGTFSNRRIDELFVKLVEVEADDRVRRKLDRISSRPGWKQKNNREREGGRALNDERGSFSLISSPLVPGEFRSSALLPRHFRSGDKKKVVDTLDSRGADESMPFPRSQERGTCQPLDGQPIELWYRATASC